VNPQLQRAVGVSRSGQPAQALGALPQDAGSRFCELCSAGLAFKLAHAVVKHGRETGLAGAQEFDLRPLLDLVALGTIADLVPLMGENRILVASGLQRLNTTERPGLVALKKVAQSPAPVGVYEVGFQLGPRLNAAGRLETATAALNLLLARDPNAAEPLARELDARNRERQQIERSIAEEVIGAVRARFNADTDYVIVEGQLLWHIGVVGIVASRVLREFHRPTVIIGGDGEEWRGSGRSIEGFDLAAALGECDDLLLRHGGHAMAAGLSIHPKNLEALRSRLNELARRALSREQLQPLLLLDAEVSLSDLSVRQLEELRRLEPAGQGNPPVQLAVRNVSLQRPPQRMGREQQHAKLWITDGRSVCEVVCWNCDKESLPAGNFDLAFAPQISEYNGSQSVQLKLLDWRPA
jgi:single-stranded-DNA-specific exonuclease